MRNGLILGHLSSRTSRWDGLKALFNPSLSDRTAVVRFLEACQPAWKRTKHLVRLTNAVHTAVFAPTGVGKGVSCVVPWLLTNPDSAVVVDFKGELFKLTADARRRMGHRVPRLDPFGVRGPGSDTHNPMQYIDGQSESMIDDCRGLAESLVIRTGQEKDPHWNDRAEQNIAVILCAVAHFANDGDKSLQAMRDVLANESKREGVIELLKGSDAFGGILSRLGHAISHAGKEEIGGILSTVQRHTQFLDTPAVAANTRSSTFNPSDLRNGKMTIYMILPPEHMRTQSPLLRMWMGSFLRAVVKEGLQS
jgi:type IV secretion system protein VirD4